MRILFVHTTLPTRQDPEIFGGAEVAVQLMLDSFAMMDDVEVLAIRGIGPGRPAYADQRDGYSIVGLPVRRPYGMHEDVARPAHDKLLWHLVDDIGWAPVDFEATVAAFRPDVALLHNLAALGWRTARRLKAMNVPVIQTLHDYYFLCPRSARYRGGAVCRQKCLDCRVTGFQRKGIGAATDAVVAVSDALLETHLDWGLFRQVPLQSVIPNAVEIDPVAVSRDWPELRLGFLGRSPPEKGLPLLASAFARSPPGTRLLVAGRVSDADRAMLLSRAGGRPIEFLGFVPPDRLFRAIDLLVVPSLWDEPFGRVSIEAQAFGVPSIVSDRGGLPMTIGHGRAGWIFEPTDPEALIRLIGLIAADRALLDEKRLGIPSVFPQFSLARHLASYRGLIEQVIERSRAQTG